jgi:hypothetical protein
MSRVHLLAAGLLVLVSTVAAAPPTLSHCTPDEEILFTCRVDRKLLSFCAPKTSDDRRPAWIQYRFGRIGAMELVFPVARTSPVAHFRFTTQKGGMWVDNTVQFSTNDHFYTLHAYGNSNIPESEGSMLVVRPDGTRKRFECADPGLYTAAGLWRFEQFQLPPVLEEFTK